MPESLDNFASRISALARGDGGYVFLVVAFTDQCVEKLLLAHMELSDTDAVRIFGDGGTLISFAAKTNIAYALKLIDKKTYEDLLVIRKVAECFRSPARMLSFENPANSDLFKGRERFFLASLSNAV